MAGIYIHIPFCKKKCNYCDFYSVGVGRMDSSFTDFVLRELHVRHGYLTDKKAKTVYFGGGTPSLLPPSDIEKIISGLTNFFEMDGTAEITIEVNPDDITKELANQYKDIGINRISIGVQSFNDDELLFLGRRHNAKKSAEAIRIFKDAGISNISIDLIYGLPNSTLKSWEHSLSMAFGMDVQHLSCYHLTYENGTPLTRKVSNGTIKPLDDEQSLAQFNLLRELANVNGFVHYEISNLAKPNYISKHNSGYWLGEEYLGLGPSAHSFNKVMRWWNPPSIDEWEKSIGNPDHRFDKENIDEVTRFNELLITRLRTIWGINLTDVANGFSSEIYNYLRSKADPFIRTGKIVLSSNTILIPSEHYFISDSIVTELLFV